jgi:hypothetical protein
MQPSRENTNSTQGRTAAAAVSAAVRAAVGAAAAASAVCARTSKLPEQDCSTSLCVV